MNRMISAIAALGLATVMMSTACSSGDPMSADGVSRSPEGTVIVGSADFPESQLLATIFAQALEKAGLHTESKLNIGSREVYVPALKDGSIDLIPEYTGATLSYLDPKSEVHTTNEVNAALSQQLPKELKMLTPSPAQNTDILAVTQDTATKYSLKTISDLVPVAGQLVLGGPPEWKTRKEGVAGLRDVYGLNFKDFKSLDVAGPITLSALVNGQVQVADLTSTDPAVREEKLVALDDDKQLFPAQNIVPIIAAAKDNDKIDRALNAVTAALTTADLNAMNQRIANKESMDTIASDWLAQHHLA